MWFCTRWRSASTARTRGCCSTRPASGGSATTMPRWPRRRRVSDGSGSSAIPTSRWRSRGQVEIGRRPVWSDTTYGALDEVNASLRGLAGAGVTVVDCDPILAVKGRQNPAYSRDWQHLNAAGYQALNLLVRPVLEAR